MPSASLSMVDLDQRPDLLPDVLALFAAASPGARHLVCGISAYMGMPPTATVIEQTAGVLIALYRNRVVGALAICPYSEEQVTLWGPALANGVAARVGDALLDATRSALQLTRYGSMRLLVDTRNRPARAQAQAHGFTTWKDNLVFERRLEKSLAEQATHVRMATSRDLNRAATLFIQGFPDTDHCVPNLERRETEGFRHYVLDLQGKIVGAAAIQDAGTRAWMKLITIAKNERSKGRGKQLLAGVCTEEAKRRTLSLAFEVLKDNVPATHLYQALGFRRRFITTIMTAPV